MEFEAKQASRRLSPIETTPPEVLSKIISYLQKPDMNSLLRVSKSFYYATYPHLWRTFDTPTWKRSTNIRKLLALVKDRGVDALGFNYTKNLSFSPWNLADPYPNSECTLFGQFFDILSDLLTTGKMKLRRIEFYWEDYDFITSEGSNFLQVVKEYSKSNPLSIKAYADWKQEPYAILYFPMEMFALECFTSFEIPLFCGDIEFEDYEIIEQIEMIVQLLQQTTSLKHLWLKGSQNYRDSDVRAVRPPELEQLQTAITNLTQLQSLTVSYLVFHPSFFIVPPKGVRELNLLQVVSIEWWRKFAACTLTNVTDLEVHAPHMGLESNGEPSVWWGPDDAEANELKDENYKFKLEEIAVRNLKRFYTSPRSFYCPEDFVDLIMKRNKDLDIKQLQEVLLDREDWRSGTQSVSRESDFGELEFAVWRVQERFMGRN
ncbi:hypothetical protein TWF481_003935 [Arthrobotrys musiformis]|uniref:F-box domain-containing protein n=1 Tax=Arthrobotrys musiformis TaxID=47236 RepID=A0AAV9WJC3_9PEZI